MARLYKLTNRNDYTRNKTKWGPGVTNKTTIDPLNDKLCTSSYLHAYEHPIIALFFHSHHVSFSGRHLWLAEGIVKKSNCGIKVGTTKLKTIKRIKMPQISVLEQSKFVLYVILETAKLDKLDEKTTEMVKLLTTLLKYEKLNKFLSELDRIISLSSEYLWDHNYKMRSKLYSLRYYHNCRHEMATLIKQCCLSKSLNLFTLCKKFFPNYKDQDI